MSHAPLEHACRRSGKQEHPRRWAFTVPTLEQSMNELNPAKPLSKRTDDEIRAQAEENLRGGAPASVDSLAPVERDGDEEAQVRVWMSVGPWDFPE